MSSSTNFRKLFKMAVFTSPAIALITMGPMYITVLAFNHILATGMMFSFLGFFAVVITFFVLGFWLINIMLVFLFGERRLEDKNQMLRFLCSYFFFILFFLTIHTLVIHIILDEQTSMLIINWKAEMFGFEADYDSLKWYNQGWFPYTVILIMVLSVNTVVLILQEMLLLLERKSRIETENIALKIKNIEAENLHLKQQLHPHFLFNSLNTLKTLIRRQPDQAENYLIKLSDLLRYAVNNENLTLIRISDEIKLCRDYIEMQTVRFGDSLQFSEDLPEGIQASYIPIFSIQLLIENAIKHNSMSQAEPLLIKLYTAEGWIYVSNPIRSKSIAPTQSGRGLANLSERYKIISGDDIRIETTPDTFTVGIKILSNESADYRG